MSVKWNTPKNLYSLSGKFNVEGYIMATEALNNLILKVQKLINEIPEASHQQLPVTVDKITCDIVMFKILKGKGAGSHVLRYDEHKTVKQLFMHFEKDGTIGMQNAKSKTMPLNIEISIDSFIKLDAELEGAEQLADDIFMMSLAPSGRSSHLKSISALKSIAVATKIKRKCSASPLASSTPLSKARKITANELATSKTRSITQHIYSMGLKPTEEYKSSFRRPTLAMSSVEYTVFCFKKTICVADIEGHISIATDANAIDTIMVAKNWQPSIGKPSVGGYLGKGFSKYCFQGKHNGIDYAILQTSNLGNKDTANYWHLADENEHELLQELKLVVLGQYFANSFSQRVQQSGTKELPILHFNSANAFIARVVDCEVPAPGTAPEFPLLFPDLLAVRLIQTAMGYQEKKFSDGHQVGQNNDSAIGKLVDAFAHHVLLDSGRMCVLADLQRFVKDNESEVILFDPQAHTYWDKGEPEIKHFEEKHQCNDICHQLRLGNQPLWKSSHGTITID